MWWVGGSMWRLRRGLMWFRLRWSERPASICYSQFANIEWKHGAEAAGCVCGAEDRGGQVGPAALRATGRGIGDERVGGPRFRAASAALSPAPWSAIEEPAELQRVGRVPRAWPQVCFSARTRRAHA